MEEIRVCNVCGECWPDTGAQECIYCGSADTYIDDSVDTDLDWIPAPDDPCPECQKKLDRREWQAGQPGWTEESETCARSPE